MSRTAGAKLFLAVIPAVALAVVILSMRMAFGQEDLFSDIKGKIAGISDQEREILRELFIRVQEIEGMDREARGMAAEVENLKNEIEDLQKAIAGEEAAYARKRESLKQFLQSYQRMGTGSYLEILLKSDSLPDLLGRINMLRDLTRNTGELLDQIEKSREKQLSEKAELSQKLTSMEDKQKQWVQALDKKKRLKEDMEKNLAALAEERVYYQEYLDRIQETWEELKPFFAKTIQAVSDLIAKGDFPLDALQMTFSFSGIRVSMDEKSLNDIIAGDPQLPEVTFGFHPGRVELNVPGKNLVLTGKFVIVNGQGLKFDVEAGSFYGMPLQAGSIEELFQEDALVLDLTSQMEGFRLRSVEITEGRVNLSVIPE